MTPRCRGPMASSSGWPSRRSPGPSSQPFTPRGPTESSACSNTWTMKMSVDNPSLHRDLYFLCVQIIGLLDVFTPQCSLDEFSDVYMVTHLMGADLNNIIRTQRWECSNIIIYLSVYNYCVLQAFGWSCSVSGLPNCSGNEVCSLSRNYSQVREALPSLYDIVMTENRKWFKDFYTNTDSL